MWVMTYAMTASFLARLSYRTLRQRDIRAPRMFSLVWWGIFIVSTLIFLPLHIVPISLFYFPPFALGLHMEYEVVWGFGLGCLVVALLFSRAFTKREGLDDDARESSSRVSLMLIFLQSAVWFGGLLYVIAVMDPSSVSSTCVHQPYGGEGKKTSALCNVNETYLFGLSQRRRYACDEDLKHWRIVSDATTGQRPKPLDEFYTIRGLPMDDDFRIHYVTSVVFGFALHCTLLCCFAAKRRESNKKQKSL